MMDSKFTRRDLLKAGAAAAASFTIIPSGILAKGKSPNEKLNIAMIGCGHRARDNFNEVKDENIVALCDVDTRMTDAMGKKCPKAKVYVDWRKCLEQKDIEAVVVSVPDHSHAFINIWAMNRGMSVYSEKPLANSVQEARLVREVYLKNKTKIATQMGVQRHAMPNMARITELIRDGAIGTVSEVRLWSGRTPVMNDYLPGGTEIPKELNWDLWIGPSTFHPFNPEYIAGGCLKWNRYWDFGSGQIGDMGSHIMDIAWWALDLEQPTSCKCEGPAFSPICVPNWIRAQWDHPANSWRPAVKVFWFDGGKMPAMPSKFFDRNALITENGAVFKGDKGYLVCDFGSRFIMPVKGDMVSHYHMRKPEELIQPVDSHQKDWIRACKTDLKTKTDFEYSGNMIEHNLLSLVAYRCGKPLEYDAKTMKATNCPEADQYFTKTYRPGYVLNG